MKLPKEAPRLRRLCRFGSAEAFRYGPSPHRQAEGDVIRSWHDRAIGTKAVHTLGLPAEVENNDDKTALGSDCVGCVDDRLRSVVAPDTGRRARTRPEVLALPSRGVCILLLSHAGFRVTLRRDLNTERKRFSFLASVSTRIYFCPFLSRLTGTACLGVTCGGSRRRSQTPRRTNCATWCGYCSRCSTRPVEGVGSDRPVRDRDTMYLSLRVQTLGDDAD